MTYTVDMLTSLVDG